MERSVASASVRSAVLVPIKAFAAAKARLAPVLDPSARLALVQKMAVTVLEAAAPLAVAVVCDDEEVAEFAHARGADVVWTPGLGLDSAVAAGVLHLAAGGFDEAIVSHADLPLATGFVALTGRGGTVTLVPDRREDGTNVAVVPTAAGFRFAYGAGSFARHAAEAERLGLAVHVERDERLAWDVDVPADLDGLPCA